MKRVLLAGMAVLVLSGPTAFAQRDSDHGTRPAQLVQYENRDRGYENRDRDELRGTPHWAKGDRLPEEFRGDRYVIEDWRGMHLNRPPRGFHWIRVGDRFMLVATRTGVIRDFRLQTELKH